MATPAEAAAMRRAIALSAAGLGTTSPNPPVGCVLLDAQGRIVGEGYHERKGEAHAEAQALAAAGPLAAGATAVVTLEPCTMCAGAVLAARVDRLVYGAADPRAGAAGSLWDVLRDRRLSQRAEVIGGVLAAECGRPLQEFFAGRRRAPDW